MKELVTESDLMAYVNGQLDADRRKAVEEFLATDPARAAEIDAQLKQNEAIRALFGPVADEPIPARLQPLRIARMVRQRRQRQIFTVAAASVLLAFGIMLGWLGSRYFVGEDEGGSALAVAALSAHQVFAAEGRHAVEVAANEEDHLVSWLSNRVGTPLMAPDLTTHGFSLVGGRLLPYEEGSAAQLMYEDADGKRLTLYITAGEPGTPEVDYASAGALHTYYWTSDAIDCAMVSDLPAETIRIIATSAWRQLVAAI
jgi:anti-sigma factor RsiW